MAENIVETIKKICMDEIRKIHTLELGVVKEIYPHKSDKDKENYECDVMLKNSNLLLKRVQISTQIIGLTYIPNKEDLVLVGFVNNNINEPIILSRIYNDEDRPPVNKPEEVVYIPNHKKDSNVRRIYMKFPSGITLLINDDGVEVESGKSKISIKRDGDISIESEAKLTAKTKNDTIIESNGDMFLKAMNIKIEGKLSTEITSGANGKFEAKGNLNIKGAMVNIN